MSALRQLRRRAARVGYGRGPRTMSWLRKRWVVLRHPDVTIRFGTNVHLGRRFTLHAPYGGTFVVGDHVQFRDNVRIEIGKRSARVEVGEGTVLTYDVVIQCSTTVEIGKRCMLGQATLLVDGNHRFRDPDKPLAEQGYDYRPIKIGDDALLLAKTTVIAGVGDHAVVGAGSIVTRPLPAYTVAVGAPARPIDYFGPEDERPPGLSAAHSDTSG